MPCKSKRLSLGAAISVMVADVLTLGVHMVSLRDNGIMATAVFSSAIALYTVGCSRLPHRDQALAEALAGERTREAAITSIAASGHSKIPLLLTWTRRPPKNVVPCAFYEGLVDTFGRTKTREAIPFLIENISMMRSCGASLAPWLKVPAVVEWNLPCVGALVKIGPDASRALMARVKQGMSDEDHLAAVFAISRIPGVPEAQPFLAAVVAHNELESHYVQEGMKLMANQ